MDNDAPTLGSLIRSLRTQNGWTLQALSDKTGIPRSTLAKVEHGRLTLGYDKLMQISKRLNIRMSELFASGDDRITADALPMVEYNEFEHRSQQRGKMHAMP